MRDAAAIRRWLESLAWAGLYAANAVAFTWPLASHAVDHLPKGNVPTSLPASAGTWALWWVSDRLAHGLVGLWDAPIFHPATGTFGYSETTLPLGIAAAPLFWFGAEAPLVYNLVVGACLVANGLAVRALAHTLGAPPLAAGLGGLLLTVSALTQHWISVLPLVPLFGIVLFFRAVVEFGREPGAARGAEVGATLGLTWLLCLQYGLFVTLVAPLLGALVPWRERSTWRGVAAGGLVAFALTGPVLLPQRAILEEAGFERSETRAEHGAFKPERSWGAAPVEPRLPIPGPGSSSGSPIYPGTIPLLLAAWGVWQHRRDRAVVSLVGISAVAIVLSSLPNLGSGGAAAWDLLRDGVPGLSLIREGKRAGATAIALLPALVALGLGPLARHARAWPLAVLLVAATLINELPEPARLQPAPTVAGNRPLVEAIRRHVPHDGVLAALPFVDDDAATPEVDRMVLQAGHGRRLVNGYSSYYPRTYWQLRRQFGARRELGVLAEVGVTHVLVPRGYLPTLRGAREVWSDEGQILLQLDPR